jgi:hypothetical protein
LVYCHSDDQIRSRGTKWTGYGGAEKYAHNVIGKREEEGPLERPRSRWVDNIKTDFKEMEYECAQKCRSASRAFTYPFWHLTARCGKGAFGGIEKGKHARERGRIKTCGGKEETNGKEELGGREEGMGKREEEVGRGEEEMGGVGEQLD